LAILQITLSNKSVRRASLSGPSFSKVIKGEGNGLAEWRTKARVIATDLGDLSGVQTKSLAEVLFQEFDPLDNNCNSISHDIPVEI
jgi:hypothetical protein